ncbi:hypothetical protein FHX37_1303 [Haloactinospora alba]|uniref:Uncharacterized protein n=1 Tax=Haloactinospora alba TaxID=405555 RepID=A0A543NHT3_9ACTN|nr:hypothetical protein [Haloactinospora alba]TQN31402.1 hypothetical protein FHX37_1303 [Haloactinospora alba]
MNAISPICLTDLAPALRWSKSADVAPLLRHAKLVDGWWRSLPLSRVLEIVGPAWLSHGIARVSTEHWDHVALNEFLPTLCDQQVELDDIAEPIRGAILATAGGWERLIEASPATMGTWGVQESCGVVDLVGTAAWCAVLPFTQDGESFGPAPSPALMVEAVRTITRWMPATAPEHVHSALGYLASATGTDTADEPEEARSQEASEASPQEATGAPRAIRTLRALRAQRPAAASGGEERKKPQQQENGASGSSPGGSFQSRLVGPNRTLRRPAFGPPKDTRERDSQEQETAAPPETEGEDYPLVGLLERLFSEWHGLERTVAAQRLFAADPVSIRLLADQLHADPGDIRAAQRSVEERLLRWLGSAEGAPVTQHLRELSDWLGSACTIDHLISAHTEHPVNVPSLGIPLWRVLITLFTDRRLHNGWLVNDDPERLRAQTREMLGDAPSLPDAGARLGRLGIREQVLRAWLLSTPGVSIRDGYVLVDPSTPAEAPSPPPPTARNAPPEQPVEANGSTTTNGLPIRRRPETAQQHEPEDEGHTGISTSARCFRAPDGRWWHRVDVSADHLNGAPVVVPPGYATYLGLQPGRLLCLTAPGADLLVLVWRDQPAFDSLRPLLRRLSAEAGDRVFITVDEDRLDARRLPAADLGDNGPMGKALHLIGYTAPASVEEALGIIAHRVSADDGSELSNPHSLLEHLNQRGDTDLVNELRSTLYATL